MTDFDLYEDILGGEESPTEKPVSQDEVDKWKSEVETTRKQMSILMRVNQELKGKCDQLETNQSSLLKTARNEIRRKDNVIAELRQKLDDILLKRILTIGSRKEMNDMINSLRDVLEPDKPPPKLHVPEPPYKTRPGNNTINIKHFEMDDIFVIKCRNTSYSCVISGDIRAERNKVVSVEQRCDVLKDIRQKSKENQQRLEPEKKDSKISKESKSKSETKKDSRSSERRKDSKDRPRTKSRSRSPDRRSNQRKRTCNRSERGHSEDRKFRDDKSSRFEDRKFRDDKSARGHSEDRKTRDERSIRSRRKSSERDSKSDRKSSDKENSRKNEHSSIRRSSKNQQSEQKESRNRQNNKSDQKTLESNAQKPIESQPKNSGQEFSNKDGGNGKEKEGKGRKKDVKSDAGLPDLDNLDSAELESLLDHKYEELKNASAEEERLLKLSAQNSETNQNNVPVHDESARDAADTSANGLLSTSNFIENWSPSSFPHYRTPPQNNRFRSESETSVSDFNTTAGIAAILKGKLVPGGHVSPSTGMIRTPTPSKCSKDKVNHQSYQNPEKINRTRHRSKEVKQEIENNAVSRKKMSPEMAPKSGKQIETDKSVNKAASEISSKKSVVEMVGDIESLCENGSGLSMEKVLPEVLKEIPKISQELPQPELREKTENPDEKAIRKNKLPELENENQTEKGKETVISREKSKTEVKKKDDNEAGNGGKVSTPQKIGTPIKIGKNLVESLGLDISSSSADESSPVKRNLIQNRRKRKRSLGFSGPLTEQTMHSAKRKL